LPHARFVSDELEIGIGSADVLESIGRQQRADLVGFQACREQEVLGRQWRQGVQCTEWSDDLPGRRDWRTDMHYRKNEKW
jgi:hypothetical protein